MIIGGEEGSEKGMGNVIFLLAEGRAVSIFGESRKGSSFFFSYLGYIFSFHALCSVHVSNFQFHFYCAHGGCIIVPLRYPGSKLSVTFYVLPLLVKNA